MRIKYFIVLLATSSFLSLSACSMYSTQTATNVSSGVIQPSSMNITDEKKYMNKYEKRMSASIPATGEKTFVVDPKVHAWGAYDKEGKLVRAGIATAGANWCPDIKRPCRTKVGTFRINSLGPKACKSSLYPLPNGGAKMPYCMFFNGNQALHGSYHVVDGNASHGCVRLKVPDAEWLRFNYMEIGTKVIVKPY